MKDFSYSGSAARLRSCQPIGDRGAGMPHLGHNRGPTGLSGRFEGRLATFQLASLGSGRGSGLPSAPRSFPKLLGRKEVIGGNSGASGALSMVLTSKNIRAGGGAILGRR